MTTKDLFRLLADTIEECEYASSEDILETYVDSGLYADDEIPFMHGCFDMATIEYPCGSPACIAGHWEALYPEDSLKEAVDRIATHKGSYTRLTMPREITECFDYRAAQGDPDFITPGHAVACIRNLIETGEVNWKATKPEGDAS